VRTNVYRVSSLVFPRRKVQPWLSVGQWYPPRRRPAQDGDEAIEAPRRRLAPWASSAIPMWQIQRRRPGQDVDAALEARRRRPNPWLPPAVPLVITRELHAIALSPLATADAWSIDPQRTQELAPASGDPFSSRYSSQTITTSPSPTPWTIDPQRTRQLP